MDQLSQKYHVEDVGRILLQAQEELRQMRQTMTTTNSYDITEINDIIERAEHDLRAKAEVCKIWWKVLIQEKITLYI